MYSNTKRVNNQLVQIRVDWCQKKIRVDFPSPNTIGLDPFGKRLNLRRSLKQDHGFGCGNGTRTWSERQVIWKDTTRQI